MTSTESRVYVGTYHKYNSGSIKGRWLDLDDYSDKEEFLTAAAELHDDEDDPELMFQDWEGLPAGMIGESSIEEDVWEWLELSDDDKQLLRIARECHYPDTTIETAREAYQGTADNEADFAQDYAERDGETVQSWLVVDWQQTWESSLRHDYTSHYDSETGSYYFFCFR